MENCNSNRIICGERIGSTIEKNIEDKEHPNSSSMKIKGDQDNSKETDEFIDGKKKKYFHFVIFFYQLQHLLLTLAKASRQHLKQ